MARENTTRHTVSGIASASPIHPQSQAQNAAAIRRAIDETPALRAKNRGSRTNTMRASEPAKSPPMSNGFIQPSKTARLVAMGISAAVHAPTYGMNRSIVAKKPQTSAKGIPRKKRPSAIVRPKPALRPE